MVLGLIIDLSVYEKSIVSIAIFMLGIPAYLIVSNLSNINEMTIANFLNANLDAVDGQAEVLATPDEELSEEQLKKQAELIEFFTEKPLYQFLPDKPVKQAYFLFLITSIASFGIWYFG